MANDNDKRPHRGNVTPDEIADPSKHQQRQVFETENRPTFAPGEKRDAQSGPDEDPKLKGEPTVGRPAGPDTTGAVAHPSEMNQPGASTELGGTPGALATGSRGRQAD